MSDAASKSPFDGVPGTSSAAGGSWGNSGGSSIQGDDGWIGTLHPSVECAYCGVGFDASTAESLESLLANHRKVCRGS